MKPRIVIVALLVLALAVPATMLAQGSKAEQEIRAVMDELHQANLKGGTEAIPIFARYYADDVERIPPNGAIYTKAQILEGFRTGKTKVESSEFSDIKIRVYGETAVATGIVRVKGTVIGAAVTGQNRWTRVFVKHGGTWQCVLYQNTPIKQ
jgi:ketosteroid isomerase-like protein